MDFALPAVSQTARECRSTSVGVDVANMAILMLEESDTGTSR